MELQEAIQNRRSIRQFLAKPVSEEIIRDLIADSLWSPSWGNTQPWEIVVVTGEKLAEFKKRNKEALLAGKAFQTDIPMPQVWPDAYMNRYKSLGKSVLSSLAIAREDKEARLQHFVRMFAGCRHFSAEFLSAGPRPGTRHLYYGRHCELPGDCARVVCHP